MESSSSALEADVHSVTECSHLHSGLFTGYALRVAKSTGLYTHLDTWSLLASRKQIVSKSNTPSEHKPVLTQELLNALVTDIHGSYFDATYGRGGHSEALLKELSEDASVIAMDQDPDALEVAHSLERIDKRFRFLHGCFSDIPELLQEIDVNGLTGLCFDVGVSTPQLKDPRRGFGFDVDGTLDMRMDYTRGDPASLWLNRVSESDLADVLRIYGELRRPRVIARHIVCARPYRRTSELANAVKSAPVSQRHAARVLAQVFQAIRIYVNDELSELEKGLKRGFECLKTGGRLAVMTFHSLEHRLVRECVNAWIHPSAPRGLAVKRDSSRARYVAKNVRASYAERESNPSARSAMMQVIERMN